jgi:hypothetical protein
MTSPDRTQRRWQSLGALAIYLAIAVLLLDRGLVGHPGYYVGRDTDPPVHMWFFNWWRYSLSHKLNPFIMDWVWAPLGINLAWTTCVPLISLISIPLQLMVGEPTTYNIIAVTMPPLAAFSAFLLCRRVSGAFWPSVLGGYTFGFSPYMLGQLLAHLFAVAVFPVPLMVLLTLKRLGGEISARRFAILLAALLTAQFLCSVEVFATFTVLSGFALLLALSLFDKDVQTRLIGLITPSIAGYLMAGALLSPYLFYMLARGFPHSPIWSPDAYSADLLAFLVPTETVMLGTTRAASEITSTFLCNVYENGAYLGLATIIFIEVFRRRYWREPVGKFLAILFIVTVFAAMGPSLQLAGKHEFWMPWAMVEWLPLISVALPVRFMLYAFLIVAVMLAMWFATSAGRPLTKWIMAALVVGSIAPNLHASFWVSPLDIPAFFTDLTYTVELEPREIVLPLPYAERGNSMYWQMQSDMYFRMAGGYTGPIPFEFARMPAARYLRGRIDLPEAADQLKAYVARFGVRAVIADPKEANFETFKQTLDALGVAPINEKGVWLYKVPTDSFSAYAKLSGAQLEARADALQFDTILEAAGAYLASGHDLSKVSPAELKRLTLLPRNWLVASNDYFDWQIGPAPGGTVAIIIVGSYEGVSPLIERYHAIASEIDYPAPIRWSPDSHPSPDLIKPLLMIFDAAHLASAAQTLRYSPPPERTTPFVAGVSSGLGPLSP